MIIRDPHCVVICPDNFVSICIVEQGDQEYEFEDSDNKEGEPGDLLEIPECLPPRIQVKQGEETVHWEDESEGRGPELETIILPSERKS